MQSSTIHNTFKLLSWHDSVRQLPSANLAQMNWRVLNDSIQLPGILETQGSQQNTNTKEGLICSVLLILSWLFYTELVSFPFPPSCWSAYSMDCSSDSLQFEPIPARWRQMDMFARVLFNFPSFPPFRPSLYLAKRLQLQLPLCCMRFMAPLLLCVWKRSI